VVESRYTHDLSLDSLLPSFRRRASQTRTFDRNEERIHFDIHLSAPNGVVVDNNIAKTELKTELRLVGTNKRFGLLGTATALGGKVFFNNVNYDITSASVDFSERFAIYPRFDLRLKTNACGADINVALYGTPDSYHLDYHGHDANGVISIEDVASCLTVGYRASELSKTPGFTTSGNYLPRGVEVLGTVTGLDQRIKKLLPIDELHFGSGFSYRSRHVTPNITVSKYLSPTLKLSLVSSLIETDDQQIILQSRLYHNTTLNLSWSNATEIRFDLGFDLKSRWDF